MGFTVSFCLFKQWQEQLKTTDQASLIIEYFFEKFNYGYEVIEHQK